MDMLAVLDKIVDDVVSFDQYMSTSTHFHCNNIEKRNLPAFSIAQLIEHIAEHDPSALCLLDSLVPTRECPVRMTMTRHYQFRLVLQLEEAHGGSCGYFALHNCSLLSRILSSCCLSGAAAGCRFLQSRAAFWMSFNEYQRRLLENASSDPQSFWHPSCIRQGELLRPYADYLVQSERVKPTSLDPIISTQHAGTLSPRTFDHFVIPKHTVGIKIASPQSPVSATSNKIDYAQQYLFSAAASLSKREMEAGVLCDDDVHALHADFSTFTRGVVPHHCVLVGSGDHWFGVLLRKSAVQLESTTNITELVYLESNNIAILSTDESHLTLSSIAERVARDARPAYAAHVKRRHGHALLPPQVAPIISDCSSTSQSFVAKPDTALDALLSSGHPYPLRVYSDSERVEQVLHRLCDTRHALRTLDLCASGVTTLQSVYLHSLATAFTREYARHELMKIDQNDSSSYVDDSLLCKLQTFGTSYLGTNTRRMLTDWRSDLERFHQCSGVSGSGLLMAKLQRMSESLMRIIPAQD